MDATDGNELVRLSNHELEIIAWPGGCRRFAQMVLSSCGAARWLTLSEALHSCGDAIGANGLRICACGGCVAWVRVAVVHHHHRSAQRNCDGLRHAARQAFTVEMTSREDSLNAISLNSSIVNGARVVGPSAAGLLIGAVGVAMCFF